jgi:hypothetical protein
MIQSGHKAKDPVVEMRKKLRAEQSRKRKRDADEGIADMGMSEEEEEEGEEEGDDVAADDASDDVAIAGGNALEDVAVAGAKKKPERQEEYLNPSRVHAQLSRLFENDQDILAAVYGHVRRKPGDPALTPDMFFMKDILVPPNRYRPEARTGSDEIAEAQENTSATLWPTSSANSAASKKGISGSGRGPTATSRTHGPNCRMPSTHLSTETGTQFKALLARGIRMVSSRSWRRRRVCSGST